MVRSATHRLGSGPRNLLGSGGSRTHSNHTVQRSSRSPFPHHSSVNEAFVRNLTWRFRAAAAQERERIEQELQVARQIQQELLPDSVPKLEGWQIATYYGPAREVGGDFYDFVDLSRGRLG